MGKAIETSVREEILSGTPSQTRVLQVAYARLFQPRRWAKLATRVRLSPRECQVAVLMVQGFTADEIARHLGMAMPTARMHIQHVFRGLGVTCRERAVIKLVLLTSPLPEEVPA